MITKMQGQLISLATGFAWAMACAMPVGVQAQSNYAPGLVANLTLPDGSSARRVDAICDAKWLNPHQYDERLADDQPTKLQWKGSLNVKTEGKYQLAVVCQGTMPGDARQSVTYRSARRHGQTGEEP